MKQNWDTSSEAFCDGYHAGLNDVGDKGCPAESSSAWDRGYVAGRKARIDEPPKFGPDDRFGPNDIWTLDEFERAQKP